MITLNRVVILLPSVRIKSNHFFGSISGGKMELSRGGQIVKQSWENLSFVFPNLVLVVYVIMPDHFHGLIKIVPYGLHEASGEIPSTSPHSSPSSYRRSSFSSPSLTIGSMVRSFKIPVTQWFSRNMDINPVWQRNYYEHIISDQEELIKCITYIRNNIRNWLP